MTQLNNSLVQSLYEGSLDIIGDVHGEYDALCALLIQLDYDLVNYTHPEGRHLVFVGDLCDRGPDTPAVILLVKTLVEHDLAQVVLGNHELNLLQDKPKPGAGWYFESRYSKDHEYQPFTVSSEEEKEWIFSFFSSLPVALERSDLRVVHAAWSEDEIKLMRQFKLGQVPALVKQYERSINEHIETTGLRQRYLADLEIWHERLEDPLAVVPVLINVAEYNVYHQMANPFRVLTSGIEKTMDRPFYASGKWRHVQRISWWNDYADDVPVIIGHYWRRKSSDDCFLNADEPYVFGSTEPCSWHGLKNNVFCVDYSVGGRFQERNDNVPLGTHTALTALRWPENVLMLEDGSYMPTSNFKIS